MVVRPNSRSLSVSQGKGLDLDAARASGLMESFELWCAERIARPLRLASYREISANHRTLDLSRVPRREGNLFHADLRMLWVEGFDLVTDEPLWLPYETVHVDGASAPPPGAHSFPVTSNGLASGNHRLEAIAHALAELIERDATTLFSLRSEEERDALRVDPSSVDDPTAADILEQLAARGAAVGIWEITSDVGVAAFRVALLDAEADPFHPRAPGIGFGCHPVREVALLRAITEAAQTRLTSIAGSREDLTPAHYPSSHEAAATEALRRTIVTGETPRCFSQAPTFESVDLEADVAFLRARLEAAGCAEIACVDLTIEGLEIPVVKIVVPGLEAPRDLVGWQPGPRARRLLAESR